MDNHGDRWASRPTVEYGTCSALWCYVLAGVIPLAVTIATIVYISGVK